MDKQAIEQIAVSKVMTRVNLTSQLSSYLDSNDKTPSWDGFIYIYKGNEKSKDNLDGRLPAQVKGHETKELYKKEISYQIELADLRNYLNDGGIILFVVYLSPNEDKTDFNSTVYYSELYPSKIQWLISKCPFIQHTLSIHLKELPNVPLDFTVIIRNCFENCKRQTSFAKSNLPTLNELEKGGCLEGIELYSFGYGSDYHRIKDFLYADTPIYARIKGLAIPYPIKYEGEVVEKTVSHIETHKISSNGAVHYTSYKVTESLHKRTIQIGNSVKIVYENGAPGISITCNMTHMLRQYVLDMPFVIDFLSTGQLMIDDTVLDFTRDKFDTSKYDLEEMKNKCKLFTRYVRMMDEQGCGDDIDYTKLTAEDYRTLDRLTSATLDGKQIKGFRDDLPEFMVLTVGNLKFAVSLTHSEEKGCYTLRHIQDRDKLFLWDSDNEIKFPAPICWLFHSDDYLKLSNIRFEKILPSIKSCPVNDQTCPIANDIMLRMISAADNATENRKQLLLDTAMSVAEWLQTVSEEIWDKRIATLNWLQIIMRKRPLNDEERGLLYAMMAASVDRKDILFAANAILGRKEEAKAFFQELEQKTRDEIVKYPVYGLISSK